MRQAFSTQLIHPEVLATWVHQLAPWEVISTFCFQAEYSMWGAQRTFEKFMARNLRDVSYFYAVERNPSRNGHHVHALWADCLGVRRSDIWKLWKKLFGLNRIEPIRTRADVVSYCAKYVCKEGAWWNVKLVSPTLWRKAVLAGTVR